MSLSELRDIIENVTRRSFEKIEVNITPSKHLFVVEAKEFSFRCEYLEKWRCHKLVAEVEGEKQTPIRLSGQEVGLLIRHVVSKRY